MKLRVADIVYKDETDIEGAIEYVNSKTVYNLDDGKPASDWVREEVKDKKTIDAPFLSSGVLYKEEGRGPITDGALGYFQNNANSVYYNMNFVSMFSSAFSGGNGLSVIPENFHKCCALFAARKSIKRDWLNWQDEYSAPNEDHEKWNEYVNDSVIYALFNTSSNQSSLRQVSYKNKLWDVENEWFWLSHEQVQKLADEYEIDDLYADAKTKGHRTFVLDYIANHPFSVEATNVLKKATELFEKSMRFRKVMMEEHPEYHLQAWDAGWYQVKLILKEYCKEDLTSFRETYKMLENKIIENVYELGFLRK